jgi:hypothetical protein
MHTVKTAKPAMLWPMLTGFVLPVGIPFLAFKMGGHLGDAESTTVLASMAWTAIVAGAGWLSFTILSRFGHGPAWRSIVIGLLCILATMEGCNRIDPSAHYHLGDPEDPYGNVRGR